MSLGNAQRIVHPDAGDEYPHLHICARRAQLGVGDSDARPRGASPSKCGAVNINTYSNGPQFANVRTTEIYDDTAIHGRESSAL